MIIVFGIYKWFQRVVGFRNDHCLNCADTRVALQVRAFWCGSLFWIPLLPLGFRKTWHCTTCGIDPRTRTRTSSRLVRWSAVVLLMVFAWAMWEGPVDPESAGITWALRILLPLGLIAAIRWAIHTQVEPSLAERLAVLPPYSGAQCPACGGELIRGSSTVCSGCGAAQLDLVASR